MLFPDPVGDGVCRTRGDAGGLRRRFAPVRTMLATLIVLAAVASPLPSRAQDPRTIPLVNQRGEVFRLADLRGRSTLLTFVATRCADACPIANAAYLTLGQRLRHDRYDARLLTVTLDPDYDTPFVMAHMAQSFSAAPHEWTFASGRPADVRRLMRSFGVVAEKRNANVPDFHTSFVYVLDTRVRLARTLLLSTGLTKDVEQTLHYRASVRRLPISSLGRVVRPAQLRARPGVARLAQANE